MLKKEIIFKLAFTVINLDKVAALAALRHAFDLRTKQVNEPRQTELERIRKAQ